MKKYKIRKLTTFKQPWMIQIYGWDFQNFSTWEQAVKYLCEHWYCECLDINPYSGS